MKKSRQEAIIDIIRNNDVATQEELTALVRERGFNATQATISRDIRNLNIIKSQIGGKQKYTFSPDDKTVSHGGALRIFREGVTSVDHAGNIVIVKTLAGMANAVCAGIDKISNPDILGTVAGDDTILCVVRDLETAVRLMDELKPEP